MCEQRGDGADKGPQTCANKEGNGADKGGAECNRGCIYLPSSERAMLIYALFARKHALAKGAVVRTKEAL